MGRAAAGTKWLTKDEEAQDGTLSNSDLSYDSGRKKTVSDIRSAMEHNRPEGANEAFFAWEKRELPEGKSTSKKTSEDGGKEVSCAFACYKTFMAYISHLAGN